MSLESCNFTVKVNNVDFSIKSVKVNTADATILDIVLNNKIYRPDVITVSYNGSGTIKSTDDRSPQAFTNQPVAMHDVNLMDATKAGFEDGILSGWALSWESDAVISATKEKVATGEYSMKIVCDGVERLNPANIKNQVVGNKTLFTVQKGKTYIIQFKIFPETGSTLNSFIPVIMPIWKQFWTAATQAVPGKWSTITKEYVADADDNKLYMLLQLNGALGTFYVDDFYAVEKEVRP